MKMQAIPWLIASILVLSPAPVSVVAAELTIPAQADEVVVELSQSGGLQMGKQVYRLHADGRLVKYPRSAKEPVSVANLPYSDLHELIGKLVENGLMEWDRHTVEEKIKDEIGYLPIMTDSVTTQLRISLSSYQDDSGDASKDIEIVYSCEPALVIHLAEDARLPEVEALLYLQSYFNRISSFSNVTGSVLPVGTGSVDNSH